MKGGACDGWQWGNSPGGWDPWDSVSGDSWGGGWGLDAGPMAAGKLGGKGKTWPWAADGGKGGDGGAATTGADDESDEDSDWSAPTYVGGDKKARVAKSGPPEICL